MREIRIEQAVVAELAREALARHGAFGFKARGSSMFPFIRDGAIVYLESVDTSLLKVGDVVLYRRGSTAVMHRVVGKKTQLGRIRTLIRGDAHSGIPETVSPRDIIGLVIGIDNGGGFLSLRSSVSRFVGRGWVLLSPLGQLLIRFAVWSRTLARRALRA
jgi:signal peptidase